MASRRGHGEGAVFKRESDGLWVARLDLGRDHTGKRKRAQRTARTKKAATEKLELLKQQKAQGVTLTTTQPSVAEWLDHWMGSSQPTSETYRTYESQIRLRIKPAIGHIKLGDLQPHHIEGMTGSILTAGLSPATAKQARNIVRRALHIAQRHGLVARNVAALAEPPTGANNHRSDNAMTADEARAILEAADGHRLGAMAYVALYLGLRRGELMGLRWEDVGLDSLRPSLSVNHSLKRMTGQGLSLSDTKTMGSQRTVPLVEPVLTKLREHRHRQAQERSGADIWFDKSIVFATPSGTWTDPSNALKLWKKWTRAAGLGDRRLHDARHTAATLLLNSGQSLETVRAVLGHSNISTTADIYARVSQDSLRAAMRSAWGS